MVVVELQPGLRHLVGRERLEVEPRGSTVADLLHQLAEEHPRLATAIVEHDGEWDFALLVVIDREVVHRAAFADRRVSPGDLIELHMALVGG